MIFCLMNHIYKNNTLTFKGWLQYFQLRTDHEKYKSELITIIKYETFLKETSLQFNYFRAVFSIYIN